jgi:hypothetical protein
MTEMSSGGKTESSAVLTGLCMVKGCFVGRGAKRTICGYASKGHGYLQAVLSGKRHVHETAKRTSAGYPVQHGGSFMGKCDLVDSEKSS